MIPSKCNSAISKCKTITSKLPQVFVCVFLRLISEVSFVKKFPAGTILYWHELIFGQFPECYIYIYIYTQIWINGN